MIKKLLLTTLLTVSVFGYEIVIDKTIEQLDIKIEKVSTLKRNNIKEVVVDSATGLMWQDDSRAKSVVKTWEYAKAYCQDLKHAGYDDWYLPSIKELETLVDISSYNPAIKKGFKNVNSVRYWSSSVDVSLYKGAWYVSIKDGGSYGYHKTYQYYVRCVRVGQ